MESSKGYLITLGFRAALENRFALGGGVTYTLRYLKAEKDIEHADSLGTVDLSSAYKITPEGTAVFLAHEWVNSLSLPFKVGLEFGRRSFICGYAEAG